MSASDRVLIEKWFNFRDGKAFAGIVDAYGGMVYASAKRILGNGTDAEDLTQECFTVLAYAKRPPRAPLGPWLHRVVTNLALNRIKSERARDAREKRYDAGSAAVYEPAQDELLSILDEAVAQLPERIQIAIVGHYLAGKSHHQIAQELGVSRQAVTFRVEQGLEQLRRILKKKGVALTGTALAAFLSSETAPALSPVLTVNLGKVALGAACGVARTGAPYIPLLIKGGAAMTVANKIGVGLAGMAAIAVFGWIAATTWTPQKSGQTVPGTVERNAADQAVIPQAESEAAPAIVPKSPPEEPAQAAAEEAVPADAKPPIDGLWRITSFARTDTETGERKEEFKPEDTPEMLIETQENKIHAQVMKPWAEQARVAAFIGTRDGYNVVLRYGERLPTVLHGTFSKDWTKLTCEGCPSLAEASASFQEENPECYSDPVLQSRVESNRTYLTLERLADDNSAKKWAAIKGHNERRHHAERIAFALEKYARAHNGALPQNLEDLVPAYLDDETVLADEPGREMKYVGGRLPAGLLQPEAIWEEFMTDLTLPERLVAWEDVLEARWGSEQPLLATALTIEYGQPYLQLSIDTMGRIVEREYRLDTPGLEEMPEIRREAQNNLKQLGLVLVIFQNAHEDYNAPGWCSVYPQYLTNTNVLTHPAEPPGTASYVLLYPATPMEQLEDASLPGERHEGGGPRSTTPVAFEVRAHGSEGRRNVLFADGHVTSLRPDKFDELCNRCGITGF